MTRVFRNTDGYEWHVQANGYVSVVFPSGRVRRSIVTLLDLLKVAARETTLTEITSDVFRPWPPSWVQW
jgi:hypothetical protein